MCNPTQKNVSEIVCPSCSEVMVSSRVEVNTGKVRVKNFPGMKNVFKTSTFESSEELELTGLDYSREIRRRHSDGRTFLSECTGVCLACNNPFAVYRIVHTSGPVPMQHSAADFEHGYRNATIYEADQPGFSGGHLLEDVMHHGAYYGYWLECWSQAFPWCTVEPNEIATLAERSLDVASSIAAQHHESNKVYRLEARIN